MWAFSDESERGNLMLFGALTLPVPEVALARRLLRTLLLPGQRRVHTAKESPRRRRVMLDTIAVLDVTCIVFTFRRPPRTHRVEARRALVEAAAEELLNRAVTSWVLDHQDSAQTARDRHTIAQVLEHAPPILYDHRASHDEPLLWAVDAVVWSVGAGGDWRRRIDHLVEVKELRP